MTLSYFLNTDKNHDLDSEILCDLSQITPWDEQEEENENKENVNNNNNNNNNKNNKKKRSNKSKNKRKKLRKRKQSNGDNGFGYEPNCTLRARGNVQISKILTEQLIPSSIKLYNNFFNIYGFMDKLSALQYFDNNNNNNNGGMVGGDIKIFNYGFHSKEDDEEILFCVAEKQDIDSHRSRGYQYKMYNKLFTKKEILLNKEWNINININININNDNDDNNDSLLLPLSVYDTNKYKIMMENGWKLRSMLLDKSLRDSLINKCQWHKVNIFKRINNKRRMTLSYTKPEFMIKLNQFSQEKERNNDDNDIKLIPVLLFSDIEIDFVIEWIWIVSIEINIDIAISFRFDDNDKNQIKVKSIHLDCDYLKEQHLIASPNHDCHCFDEFKSIISDLKIGNPDDLQNKINYYLQVIEDLKQYKQQMDTFIDIASNDLNAFQLLQHEITTKISSNKVSPKNNNNQVNKRNVLINNNDTKKNMYHHFVPSTVQNSTEIQNIKHQSSKPTINIISNHYNNNNNNNNNNNHNYSMNSPMIMRQNSFLPSPQSNFSISPNASNTPNALISPMYINKFHTN